VQSFLTPFVASLRWGGRFAPHAYSHRGMRTRLPSLGSHRAAPPRRRRPPSLPALGAGRNGPTPCRCVTGPSVLRFACTASRWINQFRFPPSGFQTFPSPPFTKRHRPLDTYRGETRNENSFCEKIHVASLAPFLLIFFRFSPFGLLDRRNRDLSTPCQSRNGNAL